MAPLGLTSIEPKAQKMQDICNPVSWLSRNQQEVMVPLARSNPEYSRPIRALRLLEQLQAIDVVAATGASLTTANRGQHDD